MGVTGTHKTKRRKRVENDRKSEGSRRKEKKNPTRERIKKKEERKKHEEENLGGMCENAGTERERENVKD